MSEEQQVRGTSDTLQQPERGTIQLTRYIVIVFCSDSVVDKSRSNDEEYLVTEIRADETNYNM